MMVDITACPEGLTFTVDDKAKAWLAKCKLIQPEDVDNPTAVMNAVHVALGMELNKAERQWLPRKSDA